MTSVYLSLKKGMKQIGWNDFCYSLDRFGLFGLIDWLVRLDRFDWLVCFVCFGLIDWLVWFDWFDWLVWFDRFHWLVLIQNQI